MPRRPTITRRTRTCLLALTCLSPLAACPADEDRPVFVPGEAIEPPDPTTDAPTTTGDTPTSSTGADDTTSGEPGTDESSGSTTHEADPFCGDGIIDPGEQCDDSVVGNTISAACLPNCVLATCGDGFVHAGVDECDQGIANNFEYGGCNKNTCKFNARCGDGQVDQPHEVCDPGEAPGPDETVPCDNECRFGGRIVFLSSVLYKGDLGGIQGADELCQGLAAGFDAAGAHTYRAWLSDATSSPVQRFEHGPDLAGVPYVLRSGVQVAADFDDLVSNGPDVGIDLTDTYETLAYKQVWTNTRPDGEPTSETDHCAGWTSASFNDGASIGINSVVAAELPAWQSSKQWTHEKNAQCFGMRHLYCFEQ